MLDPPGRGTHRPYGAAPSRYPGTKIQFEKNFPRSATQCPAVQTTLRFTASTTEPLHM